MMKKIISILLLGALITACDFGDINVNPNLPTDATIPSLLTHAQLDLAYGVGGDVSQFVSIYMQQMGGNDRIHAGIGNYTMTPGNAQRSWNGNFYSGSMNTLNILIEKADEEGLTHYTGVAKILMATALGQVTNLWGDVPYSQAFQGVSNFEPEYDNQEDIYSVIQNLLSEGIADLNQSSVLTPSGDDVIYGGDLDLWIKAANTLKARYANHLSRLNPGQSASNALNFLEQGSLASSAEDFTVRFGNDRDSSGPWFAFKQNAAFGPDAMAGEFMINLLEDLNDPRLSAYFTTNSDDEFVGVPAGSSRDNVSDLGPYYNRPDAPVNFVSYVEAKFIEAEAYHRLEQWVDAADSYNEAVIASLERVTGTADPVYVTTFASENAASIQGESGLEQIMTQKYIALFLEAEAWVDYRRTGYPELTPASGSELPNRWPYPQSEIDNNSNVQRIEQFVPMWWQN